jgi:D-tyrosyl-tRNA(Tyr) deacylase
VKVVLQRVKHASVTVGGKKISTIGPGLLLLVGIARADGETETRWLAEKVAGLRVFNDEGGKMNLSVEDIGGEILAVSQFTLLGDARKGRRPSFVDAAAPQEAEDLFEGFCALLRERGLVVRTGRFGAMMEVELLNDGPVTILLER